jgi:hypothetical protein
MRKKPHHNLEKLPALTIRRLKSGRVAPNLLSSLVHISFRPDILRRDGSEEDKKRPNRPKKKHKPTPIESSIAGSAVSW